MTPPASRVTLCAALQQQLGCPAPPPAPPCPSGALSLSRFRKRSWLLPWFHLCSLGNDPAVCFSLLAAWGPWLGLLCSLRAEAFLVLSKTKEFVRVGWSGSMVDQGRGEGLCSAPNSHSASLDTLLGAVCTIPELLQALEVVLTGKSLRISRNLSSSAVATKL